MRISTRAAARALLLAISISLVAACAETTVDPLQPVTETTAKVQSIDGELKLPDLPVAVSNNAVAAIQLSPQHYRLYSFMGLLKGRTWRDVTDRAFEYDSTENAWRELDPVPGGGRLASTAQTVQGKVYLFGGYTVAEDGAEVSTPQVYQFDPQTRRYQQVSKMPIPVDDAISGVYKDRYIYLVSGWHDTDNVANVQVFDTETRAWIQATPFPGPPVFGHAGGLAGDQLLICDGVKVVPGSKPGDQRRFEMSDECWRGAIDSTDLSRIAWQRVEHHRGPPLYRAASLGFVAQGEARILIAGGTDNPFNYNGIGYNDVPSVPAERCLRFDVRLRSWLAAGQCHRNAMDQRGIVQAGNSFVSLGGMAALEDES